ncbi:MAG TPA: hypothetical protein VME17_20065 [Bryobacteraceae bacterium]|nr:hypothetical protein [Bryobacteraceae bacterium]
MRTDTWHWPQQSREVNAGPVEFMWAIPCIRRQHIPFLQQGHTEEVAVKADASAGIG